MKIKRIHVNQHNIKNNKKNNVYKKPVITVKCNKKTYVGNEVKIEGSSTVIYRNEKPLSCGATVWIETKSKIIIDNKIELE